MNSIFCSLTPSDLAEIAINVNAGLVICHKCGTWVLKVYRLPKRYVRFEDQQPFWNEMLSNPSFEIPERYECAYCIAHRAQRKKEDRNVYRRKIKTCVGCGQEFVEKERAYWEMSQTFGIVGAEWFEEWKSRRDKGIFYTSQGFSCDFCDDCMVSMRTKRKSQSKERQRVNAQKARTAKFGLTSNLTLEQWLSILDKYGYKCAYCGGAFETMDHVVPVSFGGGTTASNVVPSCMACNLSIYHRHCKNMMLPFVSEYRMRMEMQR